MKNGLRLVVLGALAWSVRTTYTKWRSFPSFQGGDASSSFGETDLPRLSIVVLGDSSCTGPGLDDLDDIWIRRIGRQLGQRYHVTIDSLAVGGAKARDVLNSQVPQAVAETHDLAIVSVGGNDMLYGVSVGRFRAELSTIVDTLTPAVGAIVLSGVGDLGSIPRLPRALRPLAHTRGLAADRVHAELAASRSNVFKAPLWTHAEAFRTNIDLWAPDLFHASGEGHALFADVAGPTIAEALAYRED